jgi:hypothetical protein
LTEFSLPQIRINAENMDKLARGLRQSKTIKLIDLSHCTLDQEALACLVQTLLPESLNALSLTAVHFPIVGGGEGLKPFLRALPRMPHITKVAIDHLEDDEKVLLLQAVKDTKTLFYFNREPCDLTDTLVDLEIDYYLKLNRFVRQAVESPNLIAGRLWPLILARMTSAASAEDAAHALFYFVREYFANHKETTTC